MDLKDWPDIVALSSLSHIQEKLMTHTLVGTYKVEVGFIKNGYRKWEIKEKKEKLPSVDRGVPKGRKIFFYFSLGFLWSNSIKWTKNEVHCDWLLLWVTMDPAVPLTQPWKWSCAVHVLPTQFRVVKPPLPVLDSSFDVDCPVVISHFTTVTTLWPWQVSQVLSTVISFICSHIYKEVAAMFLVMPSCMGWASFLKGDLAC